jgi:hypothetical protein
MGRIIRSNRAAADLIRDARLTLTTATSLGPPFSEEAEAFLRAATDRAKALRVAIDANLEAVERLRSQRAASDASCNELVARVRDELYNLIGRRARDPAFNMIFVGGIGRYIRPGPTTKPAALRRLATGLETVVHPRIPAEVAAGHAEALRAAATALEALNDQLLPLRHEQQALEGGFTFNARYAHLQLTRLKKHWVGQGMTEPEIHAIIPHRPWPEPDSPEAGAVGEGSFERGATRNGAEAEVQTAPSVE